MKWNYATCFSSFIIIILVSAFRYSARSEPLNYIIQAEKFSARQGGIFDAPGAPTSPGGMNDDHRTAVQKLTNNSWLRFDSIPFYTGLFDSIAVYYWSSWPEVIAGATFKITIDSLNGTVIGSATCTQSDATASYAGPDPARSKSIHISTITGYHHLFISLQLPSADPICAMDKIELRGSFTVDPTKAHVYYVASTGSDDSSGLSLTKPFRTIQKAASLMQPGSTCMIRGGIYRETVRPVFTGALGAPLTFRAYNNENVCISGADRITSTWTQHSGNIYKTVVPQSPLGKYNDQVLFDGKAMWVARAPNADDVYKLNPGLLGHNGVYVNWAAWQQKGVYPLVYPAVVRLCDNGSVWPRFDLGGFVDYNIWQEYPDDTRYVHPSILMNQATDFFKGGLLNTMSAYWNSHAFITGSHTANGQTILEGIAADNMQSDNGSAGWISYVLALLDAPNEWYRDSATGMLYVYSPNGDNPGTHIVELKKRYLGFNLDSKNYINITGINFMATSMTMGDATHCIIDKCYFRNVTHYDTFHWWEYGAPYNLPFIPTDGKHGIWVSGADNVISNSSIAYSAGSGIILSGLRNKVQNCIIHDCNYGGGYFGAITVMKYDWHNSQDAYNLLISRNSLYNCQRAVLQFSSSSAGTSPENFNKAEYNDFGLCSFRGAECAQVSGQAGGYVEIHHNWFHGASGCQTGNLGPEGDMGGRPWIAHHNVFWQGDQIRESYGGWPELVGYHYGTDIGDSSIGFNNTSVGPAQQGCHSDWDTAAFWSTNKLNDIRGWGDTAYWKYQDPATNDYRLRADSPARGKGKPLPAWAITKYGLTPSYTGGTTDLGAYQYGEALWKAGPDWQEQPFVYPITSTGVSSRNYYIKNQSAQLPTLTVRKNGLCITSSNNAAWKVRIYNTLGKTVSAHEQLNGASWVLATKLMPQGMYVAKLESNNQALVKSFMIR